MLAANTSQKIVEKNTPISHNMMTLLRTTSQGRTLDGLGSYESLPRCAEAVLNTVMPSHGRWNSGQGEPVTPFLPHCLCLLWHWGFWGSLNTIYHGSFSFTLPFQPENCYYLHINSNLFIYKPTITWKNIDKLKLLLTIYFGAPIFASGNDYTAGQSLLFLFFFGLMMLYWHIKKQEED